MAKCQTCKQEMLKADSCIYSKIKIDKKWYKRVLFGEENSDLDDFEKSFLCPDCNVKIRKLHHQGCDIEECPKCHGQLISCGCNATHLKI